MSSTYPISRDAEPAPQEKTLPGAWFRFASNCILGVRLALLLPVRRSQLFPSVDGAVAQFAFGLVVILVLDFIAVEPPHQFNVLYFGQFVAIYAILVVACHMAAKIHGTPAFFLPLTCAVLACTNALVLIGHDFVAITGLDDQTISRAADGIPLKIAATIWLLATSARILHLVGRHRSPRAALARLVLFAAPAAALLAFYPGKVWYQPVTQQPTEWVDVERTYSWQPWLVSKAVSALANERPGVTDLYFAGFAGWAAEDVFMNEAQAARDLFDTRFDTRDRSILLTNNRKTAETTPLASVTNLQWALSRIARKMNTDEDILFLFVTSHGSPSVVATYFPHLRLNQLYAPTLRELLDDAGIKWRVIVISACYSGSFIPLLQDENTMVITAAAADRASFGCGHDGAFTYFGDAFIGHALQDEFSFESAYRKAAQAISTRELAERRVQSLPRIHVGAEIAKKLEDFEKRVIAQEASAR